MVNIVYDSIITGHHNEYIAHLVNYISKNETTEKYYFVVSAEIIDLIPEVINNSNSERIFWEFIPKEKVAELHSYKLTKRSFAELELIEEYASRLSVNHVYLLYFNIFQYALIFKRPVFTVSGILFMQFSRMVRNSWKDKSLYYRKYLTTLLYSKNKGIRDVFILNDDVTSKNLCKEFNTNIFKVLPDPIPQHLPETGFDINKHYNIDEGKRVLLHPGSIDKRKGTLEIIESIDLISEEASSKYAILIVGRAKADVDAIIREKINALKNKGFTIIFDNTFVTHERLKSLFLQCYAVLMPYKNPEASSGILGHAALAGKCVIAPNRGLIGDIVKQYGLGVLINNTTPQDIAYAINNLEEAYVLDEKLSKDFVLKHTVDNFCHTLLN